MVANSVLILMTQCNSLGTDTGRGTAWQLSQQSLSRELEAGMDADPGHWKTVLLAQHCTTEQRWAITEPQDC